MYKLDKMGGMYCAILKYSKTVQFRSVSKRRVADWLAANSLPSAELRIPERDRRKTR